MSQTMDESVDDGVVYMDIMSWLLSSNDNLDNVDQDERMLDRLCELIIFLRTALFDRLMMTLIRSEKFWNIKIRRKHTPPRTGDLAAEAQDGSFIENQSIEPFRAIFVKLKLACLARFHRSSSPDPIQSTLPETSASKQVHPNLPKLRAHDIKFIERWRELVSGTNEIFQENPSINMSLRQLCLASVILTSMKPFDLSSSCSHARLKKLVQQDCIKLVKASLIQKSLVIPSSTSTELSVESVITWLAVQIIPLIHPTKFAESSINVIISGLTKSLSQLFEDGNLFTQLSTSLDSTPDSLTLRPSSSTDKNLKRVSSHPLSQIVLSISLCISQLIQNSSTISDLESFPTHLANLAQITQTIHETWRVATISFNQATLPEFISYSTSINDNTNTAKLKENLIDRWLRNTFFCCVLILGGLVNKLVTVECSDDLLSKLLRPSFRILSRIHFIGLRFTSDKLSTYQATFDSLTLLSKPNREFSSAIIKEFQPPMTDSQYIMDPIRASEVIFYLNLVEKFSGSLIEPEYLDQAVVPLIWTYIDHKTQVGFHAHLSFLRVSEFCSRETMLGLADRYFDFLIQDISLDAESSLLSFDQQKTGWITLLKSVSAHSQLEAERLVSKLVELIKQINPTRSFDPDLNAPFSTIQIGKNDQDDEDQDNDQNRRKIETRKKLYKLLICRIGELNHDHEEYQSKTTTDLTLFLNSCWKLIRFQDDLIELFEIGLNQQSFKNHHSRNLAVQWWIKKINKLNSSPLAKL